MDARKQRDPIGPTVATMVCGVYFALFAAWYFGQSHGVVDPTGHMVGRDFAILWQAARLTAGGDVATVFDLARFHRIIETMAEHRLQLHLWSYPPHMLFVVLPLAALPYLWAYAAWVAVTSGGLSAAIYAHIGGSRRNRLLACLLLAIAPATLINALAGQTGALLAALLVAGLGLIDRKAIVAGILFGLMTVKPQLGLILPFYLAFTGRWTCFVSATVTTLLLVLASVLAFGADSWVSYVHNNFAVTAAVFDQATRLPSLMIPSAFMSARILGAPASWSYVAQAAVALAVAGLTLNAVRSPLAQGERTSLLLFATVLLPPYIHNYDLCIASCAILLSDRAFARAGAATLPPAYTCLAYALPLLMMPLNDVGLPIAPAVLALGFGLLYLAATARTSVGTMVRPAGALRR